MGRLGTIAAALVVTLLVPVAGVATPNKQPTTFTHLATVDVMADNGSSVAEIVDVTGNGKILVYTDGEQGEIGFVDISDPSDPVGTGTVEVGGEPTSLVVTDPYILVGVNTSESFTEPSGSLVVVHARTRRILASHDLGGQPDSLALAPDHRRAVIVLENERDEDLNDGLLPQAPGGEVLIVTLRGAPKHWQTTAADLTPVAANAANGVDLEPEYVDINSANQAVVSFQENNHLAVIDIVTGRTLSEFPAGEVTLTNVDTVEDDLINPTDTIVRRREPDAVAWVTDEVFATANEGDYEDGDGVEGGSRGFTLFRTDGSVVYESAESFEHWLMSAGHYNEGRSENKGVEPEAVETGVFGGKTLLFVGSERSNAVGVYDFTDGSPRPLQLLATGIGPEGLKAIPHRGLFVASTEKDEADAGIPTMINIYGLGDPGYPGIVSASDPAGVPVPWVALSGLAADPTDPNLVYAVSDSFLGTGFVYRVDVTSAPALITERTAITGASAGLDLEGVAVADSGNLWLGSEGNASSRPNLILEVDAATGEVLREVRLPAALEDNARSNGIEGISVTGAPGEEVVYVAIQRAWPDTGDTDGVETKIGRYDTATGTWTFVLYPLEPAGNGGWIGLSELTLLPDGTFAVVERDKGWGPTTGLNAELKAVYGVDLGSADFRPYDDPAGLDTLDKELLRDLLGDIEAASVWTAEKVEGLAVTTDGRTFVVTDNDGVDDATGETVFLSLGDWREALTPRR